MADQSPQPRARMFRYHPTRTRFPNAAGEWHCSRCDRWLVDDQFSWANGRPRSFCRACNAKLAREYKAKYRAMKAGQHKPERFAVNDPDYTQSIEAMYGWAQQHRKTFRESMQAAIKSFIEANP